MVEQYSGLSQRLNRLEELRPTINDIRMRLSKLERALEGMHDIEMTLARVREVEGDHQHDGQFRLPPSLGEIIKNMENPLQGVRRTFVCTRCRTRNRVAVHIKCTACDTSSWLGWWPDKKPSARPSATAPRPVSAPARPAPAVTPAAHAASQPVAPHPAAPVHAAPAVTHAADGARPLRADL